MFYNVLMVFILMFIFVYLEVVDFDVNNKYLKWLGEIYYIVVVFGYEGWDFM